MFHPVSLVPVRGVLFVCCVFCGSGECCQVSFLAVIVVVVLFNNKKKVFTFFFARSCSDRGRYIWYQSAFNPATVDRQAFHFSKPVNINPCIN
jgi:hypothetical protein